MAIGAKERAIPAPKVRGAGLPGAVLLAPFNGGLSVARALGRRGESVTLLANPSDSYTASTRHARGEVLPALPQGRDAWLERIEALGNCAVLTGSDLASEFLASEATTLSSRARTFEGMDSAHLPLMNKRTAYEIADRAGVRRPMSACADTVEGLLAVAEEIGFPCIVKPSLSHEWRALFGDERVGLCADSDDLLRWSAPGIEAGLELMISEYVPGGDNCVEEAILVRAEDGSYPVAFGCRKLRQHPAGFGAASLCVSAPVSESMELARRLLDQAGYVGVAGIETKHHRDTGEVVFLEANVRIPTQWGLGDIAGGDSSWRLYAALAGLPLGPQPELRYGARLVFPELEVHAALGMLRGSGEGHVALRERLRGWRGAGDRGVIDFDDPGPGLALARRALGNRILAPARRRKGLRRPPV